MNPAPLSDHNTLAQAIEWGGMTDSELASWAGGRFAVDPGRVLALRMMLDDHSKAAFPMLCGPNIGEGGYGKVREFKNLLLHESWAVKFLNDRTFDFLYRESQKIRDGVRNLNISPHITVYKGCGTMANQEVQCSLHIPGESMRELMQTGPSFIFEKRLEIALALAKGIEGLQERNLIHRDVKPDNIILSPEEDAFIHPTLIDFDFLIDFPSLENQMRTFNLIGGSLKYLAPELLDFFDQKSNISSEEFTKIAAGLDVYALGVTLAEFFGATIHVPKITNQNEVLNFIKDILEAKKQRKRLQIDFKALNSFKSQKKWKFWRDIINSFSPKSQLIKLILNLTDWNWKKRITIQQAREKLENILEKVDV